MSTSLRILSRIGRVAFYFHLAIGLGIVLLSKHLQTLICSVCPDKVFPTIFLLHIPTASFVAGVLAGVISLAVVRLKPCSPTDDPSPDRLSRLGARLGLRFSRRFWVHYLVIGIMVLGGLYIGYRWWAQGVHYRLLVEEYDLDTLLLVQYIAIFFTVLLVVGISTSIANYWKRSKIPAILLMLILPVPLLPLGLGTMVLYRGFSEPVPVVAPNMLPATDTIPAWVPKGN